MVGWIPHYFGGILGVPLVADKFKESEWGKLSVSFLSLGESIQSVSVVLPLQIAAARCFIKRTIAHCNKKIKW